uniref:Alpha/beta hydrolase n=1 Tax=Paulinella longichromatophora TaxID=1708747 RepID=A0A2H4ZNP0_9EUKA|nr:alpha/beta hydrolase [Paulinella longichromatophora]
MNQSGEIIAMHGWSSDSSAWDCWAESARYRGWCWQSGERGYGSLPMVTPQWRHSLTETQGPRVLMVHSFGLYLTPNTVLAAAEIVVLLNSFNHFIPSFRHQHPIKRKIQRMINNINCDNEKETLLTFLSQANLPVSTDLTSLNVMQNSVSALGRLRLLEDLYKLSEVISMPKAFPMNIPILVINTQCDQIVGSTIAKDLVKNLSNYIKDKTMITHWSPGNIGHNLYQANLLESIFDWLETKK